MEAISEQKNTNGKAQGIAKQTQPDGKTTLPIEGESSEKMSFLKKWWFWAAIGTVIVIGALVFFLF